jgi:hypothetical protein
VTLDYACAICGNPVEPSAYVCSTCTSRTSRHLRGAELAGEVETTVALLARYASRGGVRTPEPVPADGSEALRGSQRVVEFAWAASRELPLRGALRPTRLPFNFDASKLAAEAFNDIATWGRAVEGDRGEEVPTAGRGEHQAAVTAAWLQDQLDWIRHQQFAAEALTTLGRAGDDIKRIVDSPPGQRIAGVCNCGVTMYARENATGVTCESCGLDWVVEEAREHLRETLRSYLVTPAEAAWLLAFFGLTGNRDRSRKTIVVWASRGLLAARTDHEGVSRYLFGEVLDRATRHMADAANRVR